LASAGVAESSPLSRAMVANIDEDSLPPGSPMRV
jgi:hypothetical protein